MKSKTLLTTLVAAMLVMASCQSHYQLANVSRSRILIDKKYDAPSPQAEAFLAPFKVKVDSMMSPVVGTAATYLHADRPEAPLSNLLPDIMMWTGQFFNEQPQFAVYNIGGIRAALAEGKVTYGDIVDVAPFENKVCFLTLTGEKVLELFQQIAHRGGEGLSHGVQLRITKDGKLLSARLNGKEIEPQAKYRIVTLDYLSQGNDEMVAFKAATDLVSPQEEKNNVRYYIIDYFRAMQKASKSVESSVEGRVVVE